MGVISSVSGFNSFPRQERVEVGEHQGVWKKLMQGEDMKQQTITQGQD